METKRNATKDLVIEKILNEKFETRKEKINYLKKMSKDLKLDKNLRKEIKKEFDEMDNVENTFSKAKKILNKEYNGFASTLFLAFVTLFTSSSLLLYLLITIGYFNL